MTSDELIQQIRIELAKGASIDERSSIESGLAVPRLVDVQEPSPRIGSHEDAAKQAWLVFEWPAENCDPYRIVASHDGHSFALALPEHPPGNRLVVLGWQDSFVETYRGM